MAKYGLDEPANGMKPPGQASPAAGLVSGSGGGGYGAAIGKSISAAFGSGGGGGASTPYGGATGIAGGGGGGQQGGGGGGLNSASGGNFFSGLGNAYGFGKPTTIGHYEGPQANRNDYFLGGSQQAAQGLLGASDDRAAGYANRGVNFDASGANAGIGLARGNLGAANALRGNEAGLTRMLQQQASGQGPSIAADTYTKAAGDATRRAQSLATSARGGSGLLGARQAAELGFQGGQDAALQSGMIRKQEMLDARGLLGQQLAQRNQAEMARGGLGLGIAGAGLDVSRTGTGFQLQNRGINDSAEQAERGRYMQMLLGNQQGLMGYNQDQGGFDLSTNQLNADIDKTNLQQQNAQDAKRRGFMKSLPVVGKYVP